METLAGVQQDKLRSCPHFRRAAEQRDELASFSVDRIAFGPLRSQGRIAGYRIRNGQSAALESRSTKNGDAADAYDESMRSILLAMMKSFSCSPLIFLVLSETVA